MTEKKVILIVDDEPDILQLLKKKFEKAGFEVRKAYDGVEALVSVEEKVPDIILLDVMMPEMDGYEVTEILKSNEATENISIILLTAVADVGQMAASRYSHEDGMKTEADDYISKADLADVDIVERVNSLLAKD